MSDFVTDVEEKVPVKQLSGDCSWREGENSFVVAEMSAERNFSRSFDNNDFHVEWKTAVQT